MKDLFSCLIKKKKEKLDKLLFARSTALEGKVDRLSQMNKSLQNHDRDRLAEMEKQHNEVIYPLVEKMDRLKDALKKKLQVRIIQQEARLRKYNLSFYHIPKEASEVTHKTIIRLLHKKLSILFESAKSTLLENLHRVQNNLEGTYKPNASEAVVNLSAYDFKSRKIKNLFKGLCCTNGPTGV